MGCAGVIGIDEKTCGVCCKGAVVMGDMRGVGVIGVVVGTV